MQRVEAGEMPPAERGKPQPLSKEEVAVLREWIAAGAHWPRQRKLDPYERTTALRGGRDWWAFQPISRPAVPQHVESGPEDAPHPVDAFVARKLDEAGMTFAPQANQRTLIRRAYLDLWGLPPEPEEVDAFLADRRPDAWERLIDRLLASHHYGERWGRYWLDVVRFAETCGYERDQLKPEIWRYRDWVIDALNRDLPYDTFMTHQLAGDEIPGGDQQSAVATGMIRAGTWNDEPNDPADYVYERLEDMVHTATTAFLGLTVKCARCHDHKFDPIPQADYYRMAGFFWPGYLGQANLGGPSHQQLGFPVFGWTDRGPAAEPLHLLLNGERKQPADEVPPGFLSAIPELDQPLEPPPAGSKTTHRRRQLAEWLCDARNPLPARVIVNRIWLYHFGQGIVRTPNNFGFKGAPPTHPQLLDFLAAELVAPAWESSGEPPRQRPWTIKRIHKLIMTSRTYRQDSHHPQGERYAQHDFPNRLWWRQNRRRLDAEALRDSLLKASGALNPQQGGPSFYPAMSAEALEGLSRKDKAWSQSDGRQRARRSVYMMTKRSRILPLMTVFDFCDTTRPCGQRSVTTVAPQALALLNNDFAHAMSRRLASRVASEAGRMPEAQVRRLWQVALLREPDADELAWAREHLREQEAAFEEQAAAGPARERPVSEPPTAGCVLWLRADRGVHTDAAGGVSSWRDQAKHDELLPHDATQAAPRQRPRLVPRAIGDQPAIQFDGQDDFLHLAGQLFWSQQFSIVAVATHRGPGDGPRELLSNWHRRGRTVNSVFLGTRGAAGVRFTDAFAGAGQLHLPQSPFSLIAVSAKDSAATYQSGRRLAAGPPLKPRALEAPYVLGTQGNYGREWWHGELAELIVYDRPLEAAERESIDRYLAERYGLQLADETARAATPQEQALASLCHVLLNTNEFLYVD